MDGPVPLPTLLSQVLVAYTMEFDNEAEHRLPHTTTDYGTTAGALTAPWLVSMAMWWNCIRHVTDEGITVAELERRARTHTNLDGMRRWGYVWIETAPDGRKSTRANWVLRAKPGGRKAKEIWQPLFGVMEKRWQRRFGGEVMDRLHESLMSIDQHLDSALPDCLPILGYGILSKNREAKKDARKPKLQPAVDIGCRDQSLPAVLARVLLAFAIEFETDSKLSLAICANVVRVLDAKGVRVRDLPIVSGVSKPAISMAMGILRKFRVAEIVADPSGGKWKVVRLTAAGRQAQSHYLESLAAVEGRWHKRYGAETIRRLRESLEELAGDGTAKGSPLFEGLEPYPDGWRAAVRRPATLPHYPMVLHRGGYPDGA